MDGNKEIQTNFNKKAHMKRMKIYKKKIHLFIFSKGINGELCSKTIRLYPSLCLYDNAHVISSVHYIARLCMKSPIRLLPECLTMKLFVEFLFDHTYFETIATMARHCKGLKKSMRYRKWKKKIKGTRI
jgi:hypothetical protein